MRRLKVAVIGNGIVGSSFAWWLSLAGAEVTVVYRDGPEIGDSATACSWSWINAGLRASPNYSRFRCCSIEIWDEMLSQVDGIPISGNSSLIWDQSREDMEAFVKKINSLGRSCLLLNGSELRKVAPYLSDLPPFAVFTPSDNAIEPVQAALALIRASGASLINARAQALAA